MGELLNLKNDLKIDLKLESIWSEYHFNNSTCYAPTFQEEILKNSITFLSLNPSLRPEAKEKSSKGFYPRDMYPYIDSSKAKADYNFFQKFYNLGRDLEQPWTFLDLLYERESSQKLLEVRYNPKAISKDDKKFLQNQIELTFNILKQINPKVVVVSNAWADKLIHANLTDLGLKQEHPSEDNNFVYRIDNIPFITLQSRYMGSWQHYRKSYSNGRRNGLIEEIQRVISF